MNNLNETICSLLKKRLKKVGLSYRDVAEHMGISEVSVKRLLNQQQPMSIGRISEMSLLVQEPLSSIISEAEKAIASVPSFNSQQDKVFCERPELYTIFVEIVYESASSHELIEKFGLDEPSLYLYLRRLEDIDLIEITSGLQFRLLVPKHISFDESARFPMFFKNQIIDGLKQKIQWIDADKNEAYFITAKFRLTEDEFVQYNLRLEDLMQEVLKFSQSRDSTTINTSEYTIVDMGAKGRFHPEHKKPQK
ncbi:helix-turn-helix domain-containing protein [Vibrio sp. DW001]|uniref:helix-turn-helix domain-containing protein n=1 Tax=Vibrio sp. DW001 TaxID=2912315 RepID=UPI0023B06EC0|nr:helix-turn-helix transcriptional regulator [Vibrio sp. DW001]WED25245.1 helix-turn-helix domain-containing protein [Vibrio sp. DW001]